MNHLLIISDIALLKLYIRMSKILLSGLLLFLSQLIYCDGILMGSSSSIPNYRELVK